MTHEINKPLARPLSLTSGILGLIQGLAWTIFSLLCILSYFDTLQLDAKYDNETAYYQDIYRIFLDTDHKVQTDLLKDQDLLVRPQEFFIFMWFYFAFSLFWTVISSGIIWAMVHDKWQLTKGLFGSWAAVTSLTSIVDIVLMSLLVVDYMKIETLARMPVCYGIVMSLAARGYVLWVINVIFAAIMTRYTIDLILHDNQNQTMPIIHGYESNDITPPWFDEPVKSFWGSPQRVDSAHEGNVNAGFERSQSFYTPPDDDIYAPPPGQILNKPTNNVYSNVYNPPSSNSYAPPTSLPTYAQAPPTNENSQSSFAQAIAERTATIGKNKGKRSPVNRVVPPVIPDPDYTPPSTPTGLKSVLRSKSNYDFNEPY